MSDFFTLKDTVNKQQELLTYQQDLLKRVCDRSEVRSWLDDVRLECLEGVKAAKLTARQEIEERVRHKVE